jgi:hypothetical protein
MAATPLVLVPIPRPELRIITIDDLPSDRFNRGRATTAALYCALDGNERAVIPPGVRTHYLPRGGLLAELPTLLADRALSPEGRRAIAHAWNVEVDTFTVREPRAPEDPDRMLFFSIAAAQLDKHLAIDLYNDPAVKDTLNAYCGQHELNIADLRLFRPNSATRLLNGVLRFATTEAAELALGNVSLHSMRLERYRPLPPRTTASTQRAGTAQAPPQVAPQTTGPRQQPPPPTGPTANATAARANAHTGQTYAHRATAAAGTATARPAATNPAPATTTATVTCGHLDTALRALQQVITSQLTTELGLLRQKINELQSELRGAPTSSPGSTASKARTLAVGCMQTAQQERARSPVNATTSTLAAQSLPMATTSTTPMPDPDKTGTVPPSETTAEPNDTADEGRGAAAGGAAPEATNFGGRMYKQTATQDRPPSACATVPAPTPAHAAQTVEQAAATSIEHKAETTPTPATTTHDEAATADTEQKNARTAASAARAPAHAPQPDAPTEPTTNTTEAPSETTAEPKDAADEERGAAAEEAAPEATNFGGRMYKQTATQDRPPSASATVPAPTPAHAAQTAGQAAAADTVRKSATTQPDADASTVPELASKTNATEPTNAIVAEPDDNADEGRGAAAGGAAPQATNFGGRMYKQTATQDRPPSASATVPAPTPAAQPSATAAADLPTTDTSNPTTAAAATADSNSPPSDPPVPQPQPPPHTSPPQRAHTPVSSSLADGLGALSPSREGMPCQPENVTRLRAEPADAPALPNTEDDDPELLAALADSLEIERKAAEHRKQQKELLDASIKDSGLTSMHASFERADGNCLFVAATTCLTTEKVLRRVKGEAQAPPPTHHHQSLPSSTRRPCASAWRTPRKTCRTERTHCVPPPPSGTPTTSGR